MNTINLSKTIILVLVLCLIVTIDAFAQARFAKDERQGFYYGLGLSFADHSGAGLLEVGITSQGRIDVGGVLGIISTNATTTSVFGESVSLYPIQQFLDNTPFSVSFDQSAIFTSGQGGNSSPIGNLTFSAGGSIFTTIVSESKMQLQPTVGAQWVKTPGDLEDNFWLPYVGLTFIFPKTRGGAFSIAVSLARPKDGPTSFGFGVSNFVLKKHKVEAEYPG